jgi:hypothetical protein
MPSWEPLFFCGVLHFIPSFLKFITRFLNCLVYLLACLLGRTSLFSVEVFEIESCGTSGVLKKEYQFFILVFRTPLGFHAGDMTLGGSVVLRYDAHVIVESPNLSFRLSTAFNTDFVFASAANKSI